MRITTVVSVLLRECSAASAAELDTRAAHSLSNNQPDVKCWKKRWRKRWSGVRDKKAGEVKRSENCLLCGIEVVSSFGVKGGR